jgi:hypothetical protein
MDLKVGRPVTGTDLTGREKEIREIMGQLAYEITGQVLKNRKFEESFIKLKNNLGEILTNIKFREEIQDAEFILSFGKPQKDPREQLRSSVRYIESFQQSIKERSVLLLMNSVTSGNLMGKRSLNYSGVLSRDRNNQFISSAAVMNR